MPPMPRRWRPKARGSACATSIRPLRAVARAIRAAGGAAIGHMCDASDPNAVAAVMHATEQAFGGVQVLAVLFGKTGCACCPSGEPRYASRRSADSNHRSRVRKSGRCQVPAIRPGSVEH